VAGSLGWDGRRRTRVRYCDATFSGVWKVKLSSAMWVSQWRTEKRNLYSPSRKACRRRQPLPMHLYLSCTPHLPSRASLLLCPSTASCTCWNIDYFLSFRLVGKCRWCVWGAFERTCWGVGSPFVEYGTNGAEAV
jgi:hypothetical protein